MVGLINDYTAKTAWTNAADVALADALGVPVQTRLYSARSADEIHVSVTLIGHCDRQVLRKFDKATCVALEA